MKKAITVLAASLLCQLAVAQTATELLGKWQLVSFKTTNGEMANIQEVFGTKEVYQVFKSGNVFEGIQGAEVNKGTWLLSADNKVLSITVGGNRMDTKVEKFTPQERVISLKELGTLGYEKR